MSETVEKLDRPRSGWKQVLPQERYDTVRMPAALSAAHRARLEEIARTCPVARSLSSEVKQEIVFEYG
jgi:uncharacterized OsmC-like protein